MTDEERFQRIEKALSASPEHHARHIEEIAELRAMHKVLVLAISKVAETQLASAEGMNEFRQEFQAGMKELRDAQQITEDKLHALIDTVDRIIQSQGGHA
jgi:hypothetical protein